MERNLLARTGRWCWRHRWWVLLMWSVIVAGGGLAAGPVSDSLVRNSRPAQVESIQAHSVVAAASGSSGELVGVLDRIDPHAPAVGTLVNAALTDLEARPDV